MRTKAIDIALKHIKQKAAKKSTGRQQISKKRKYALLEKLKGLGEGIWNEDAQKYVNRLRK
jgi:hypothetical protein